MKDKEKRKDASQGSNKFVGSIQSANVKDPVVNVLDPHQSISKQRRQPNPALSEQPNHKRKNLQPNMRQYLDRHPDKEYSEGGVPHPRDQNDRAARTIKKQRQKQRQGHFDQKQKKIEQENDESDIDDNEFENQDIDSGYSAEDRVDIFRPSRSPYKIANKNYRTEKKGYGKLKNYPNKEIQYTGDGEDESWGLSQSQGNVTNQQLLFSNESEPEYSDHSYFKEDIKKNKKSKSKSMMIERKNDLQQKPSKGKKEKQRNRIKYVSDIYEGEKKSAQINMMLCQAIAIEDEHQFQKTLKNMIVVLRNNPKDLVALRAINMFAGKEFHEVKVIGPVKEMRSMMNEALCFAIELGRESIGFDIILYAKMNAMVLTINEVQIQILIKGEMYELIEDLIKTNAFLSIDETKVSNQDLFEINRVQERKKSQAREDQELLEEKARKEAEASKDETLEDNSSSKEAPARASGNEENVQQSDYFEGGAANDSPHQDDQLQNIKRMRNASRQMDISRENSNIKTNTASINQVITENQNEVVRLTDQQSSLANDQQKINPIEGSQKDKELDLDQVLQDLNLNNPENPNGKTQLNTKDQGIQIVNQNQQDTALKPIKLITPGNDIQQKASTNFAMSSQDTPDQKLTGRPLAQQLSEVPELTNTITHQNDLSTKQKVLSSNQFGDQMNEQAQLALKDLQQETKPKFVEKYLKISDFIEYIMDNRDIFIGELFKKVKNKEEEDFIFLTFLENFMLNVQDVMDFDRSLKILIDNNIYRMLIDELFEQTDQSLKSNEPEIDLARVTDFKSARYKKIPSELEGIFRKYARTRILVQLINQSVLSKRYHIAYEITKRFLGDLLKTKYLPIFDPLFNNFYEYTTFYEAKVALLLNCMPLMNRKTAARIMKILEEILNEPASNSVLRNNVNPLRVGLMLYRLIDTIQHNFGYSDHTSNLMKDLLSDQMAKMLEMYNDPDELMVLVEQTDYEGNDSFWYLDEYDLYNILDSRIMDRVIQKKFNGKYDTNVSVSDYSTGYTLLQDKYQLYATDRVFSELRVHVFNFDRASLVHGQKFHVWKHSMYLRAQIDLIFTLVLSIVFQLLQNEFSISYQNASKLSFGKQVIKNESINPEDLKLQLILQVDSAAFYLYQIRNVCVIHLLFPLNQLMIWFFIRQTKRKSSEPDMALLTELILFVVTCILWNRIFVYEGPLQENTNVPDGFTNSQHMIMNFIYLQQTHQFEITILLAILAMSTWFKLLIRLMLTQVLGPLFKVIAMMLLDLGKFAILWFLVLCIFASGAAMVFSKVNGFPDFYYSLILYFDYSLGSWDSSIYCSDNSIPEGFCLAGQIFIIVILLVNLVLLLNLVIAILSSTYAFYEDKKLGLYYEVLVAKFPSMEYDDNYGAVACAQPPLNLMILPFWWLTLLPWNEKFIEQYIYNFNQFLCHLLYFPFGVTVVLMFLVRCLIYVPLAYFKHSLVLIQTMTDSDETMDEFHEKLERFFTILKFIFFGPFILLASVPIDVANFFINLYSKPFVEKYDLSKESISLENLEVFIISCKEQLKEFRLSPDYEKGSTLVPFVELNKRLQAKLDIENQIFRLLFDNSDGDKFYFDENTKTQKLSPTYLKGLKEFILLKKLVAKSADKTGMVDIQLLLDLANQVDLRNKMLEIEINAGDLDIGPPEEYHNLNLYEFTKVEPSTVENMLAEEGQVLDIVVEKVNSLHENMQTMQDTMNQRFDHLQNQIETITKILTQNPPANNGNNANNASINGNNSQAARQNGGSEDQQTAFTSVQNQ